MKSAPAGASIDAAVPSPVRSFGDDTTVGMVRLYATEAAKRLTDIFVKQIEAVNHDRNTGQSPLDEASPGFRGESSSALDDLFGE